MNLDTRSYMRDTSFEDTEECIHKLTKAVTVQSMTLALAYRAELKTGLDNLVAKYIRKFGLHSTSLSPRAIKALPPCTEIGKTSTSLHKSSS
jgi:hypothetical protein